MHLGVRVFWLRDIETRRCDEKSGLRERQPGALKFLCIYFFQRGVGFRVLGLRV